jgi:hypothetical protein
MSLRVLKLPISLHSIAHCVNGAPVRMETWLTAIALRFPLTGRIIA